MNEAPANSTKQLPPHWVGVNKHWSLFTDKPLGSLVSITPWQLRTHGLIVGKTGSGKTTLVHHLIAQDIKLGHSFFVLDLRGDLVGATLELCAGRVDPRRVALIDLREKDRPLGFNPLYGNGEPYFRALSVLDAVEQNAESWGVQLAETCRNALLLLAEVGRPITDLESVLYNEQFRLHLMETCRDETLRSQWQRYNAKSVDKQRAEAGAVMNKLSLLLATKTVRQILGHPQPIDLEQHLNAPGSIILVSLAFDELHSAGRMMGNLILSALSREIFARVSIPESRRNPVRLYVDEFEHFGTTEFEALLAEGRKFRLSLVLAHQTMAQLSPRMRSLILNNVGTKAVFRCGREDEATLNRDLTGSTDTYQLTELPVGSMVLWRHDYPILEVEVNEPLIHGDVGQTRRALAFRSAVLDQQPLPKADPTPPQVIQVPFVVPPNSLGDRRGGFLKEHWL